MSIATNPSSNKGRLLPADLPPGSVITPQTPNHTFRTAQKGLGNQVIPRIILILNVRDLHPALLLDDHDRPQEQ